MTIPSELSAIIRAEVTGEDRRLLADFGEASLTDDLMLDSIARVHIAIEVEDLYSLIFTDEVVQSWNTVGDVARSVEKGKLA